MPETLAVLKTRILTAAVLVAALLAALFSLPPPAFTLLIAAVILGIGGWESARLAGLVSAPGQALWIAALLAAGVGCMWLLHLPAGPGALFGAATLGWLVLICWLARYDFGRAGSDRMQPVKLAAGVVILVPAFAAIAWLQFYSAWLVILPIAVIAAADIGAYFTGRAVGGPRLAARISPGKTRSGAAGGLLAGAVAAGAGSVLVPGIPFGPAVAVVAGLLMTAVSIGGDLLISLLKRHRGIKDTSGLLPGHGGLLDRIDSLVAALPPFALLVWWTGN